MSAHNDYVNTALCRECGGHCCSKMPGAAMPVDFGAPDKAVMLELITDALRSGDWSIDWWEGDPRDGKDEIEKGFFLRPATVEHVPGTIFDPTWGGRCVFLSSCGCAIFKRRPSGCRGLQPSAHPDHCKVMHSSKQDAAIAWLEYHDILIGAAENA